MASGGEWRTGTPPPRGVKRSCGAGPAGRIAVTAAGGSSERAVCGVGRSSCGRIQWAGTGPGADRVVGAGEGDSRSSRLPRVGRWPESRREIRCDGLRVGRSRRRSPGRLLAAVSEIGPLRGDGCLARESVVVRAVQVMAGPETFLLCHPPRESGFPGTVPGGEGGGHRSPSRWPTRGTKTMARSLRGFRRQGVIRGGATAGRGLREVTVARTGFEEPSTQTNAARR